MQLLKHFPDNFMCFEYNGMYFTHFVNLEYDNIDEISATYICATSDDIARNYAYMQTYTINQNNANRFSIISIIADRLNTNKVDISKCKQLLFSELPTKVKKLFRMFEKHDNFIIRCNDSQFCKNVMI